MQRAGEVDRSSIPAALWQILEDSAPFCTGPAMQSKHMQNYHVESKDGYVCPSVAFDCISDPEILRSLL